jgi:hypothetical protein
MRLVAGFAGDAGGMLFGVDLRESLGLGRAGRVTANAEDGGIEFGWGNGGIVGVLGERSMAGFAVDVCVLAGLLGIQDVGMAGLAGLMSGEVDWAGGDLGDGGAAIVAILAETLGHDEMPDYEKHEEEEYEQKCEPEKMSCIFQKLHWSEIPSRYDRALGRECLEPRLVH